ncbi:MAG: hypothetical protein ABFD92_04380, partial [Planctomycetaceae bacterium]
MGAANEIERNSLNTMYQARGYAYSEEKGFLDSAKAQLELVKKALKEAKEHATKFNLAVLKANAEKAEIKALEYEQLFNDTVARTEALNKNRESMNTSGETFLKVSVHFVEGQNKNALAEYGQLFKAGIGAAGDAKDAITQAKLAERLKKITLGNDVIDIGNTVRVGNWKAQSERDPKQYEEALKKFSELYAKLDELKPITHLEADLKEIEDCRAAAKGYESAMTSFLANWTAREELGKKRGVVAQAVLDAAVDTAKANMDSATESSNEAASSLATSSLTMIIGLSVATVVGILMAIFITRSITGPINRVIAGLSSGAEQTSSAAGQVSAASQSLAQGSS